MDERRGTVAVAAGTWLLVAAATAACSGEQSNGATGDDGGHGAQLDAGGGDAGNGGGQGTGGSLDGGACTELAAPHLGVSVPVVPWAFGTIPNGTPTGGIPSTGTYVLTAHLYSDASCVPAGTNGASAGGMQIIANADGSGTVVTWAPVGNIPSSGSVLLSVSAVETYTVQGNQIATVTGVCVAQIVDCASFPPACEGGAGPVLLDLEGGIPALFVDAGAFEYGVYSIASQTSSTVVDGGLQPPGYTATATELDYYYVFVSAGASCQVVDVYTKQ